MAAEIVHDDNVAKLERRQKELLDIGFEAFAQIGASRTQGKIQVLSQGHARRTQATSMEHRLLSEDDFESSLDTVCKTAAGSIEGVFGPASLTWRVDREAAVFLGAGRALLLQLAHPWVAAAIAEHSRTFADPIARFHQTFNTVFTMVFGTRDQALAAARRLHRRHAAVTGTLPWTAGRFSAGSQYRANEVSALRWVHATLAETAVLTHHLVLPALTDSER